MFRKVGFVALGLIASFAFGRAYADANSPFRSRAPETLDIVRVVPAEGNEYEVYSRDGRILQIPVERKDLYDRAREVVDQGLTARVLLGGEDQSEILDLQRGEKRAQPNSETSFADERSFDPGVGFASENFATPEIDQEVASYQPTVFGSLNDVSTLHQSLETDFKKFRPFLFEFGSECTARAEVWTYWMYKARQIKSMKVFVFYSEEFRRDHKERTGKKFKWWFHVSPYVLAKDGQGAVVDRVIDRTFSDRPLDMKGWTDIFIDSHRPCVDNLRYQDFSGELAGTGRYGKEHCFLIRAPMYYYFPVHLQERHAGEAARTSFVLDEVKDASKALRSSARGRFERAVGLDD